MKGIIAIALAMLLAVPVVSAESNADGSGTDAATYYVTLPGYSSTYGVLYADAPSDYDTYVITVTAATTVRAVVADCCIMGDTMALKAGSTTLKATSPEVIDASKAVGPGTYTAYVGYVTCPGGYPAGYTATFSG